MYHLRLGVFCADGAAATWTLAVRVSNPNLHTPHFEQVQSPHATRNRCSLRFPFGRSSYSDNRRGSVLTISVINTSFNELLLPGA